MAVSKRMWYKEQERKKRERMKRAKLKRNIAVAILAVVVIVVIIIIAKGCGDSKDSGSIATPTEEETTEQTALPTQQVTGAAAQTDATLTNADFFSNSAFVGNALPTGISRYGILPESDFYSGVSITLENVYNTAAVGSSIAIADELKSKKFSKIILSFGEAELAWEDQVSFGDKYFDFIEKVKSYQSSANIYLVAIPPITKSLSEADSGGLTAENIENYNYELKTVAVDERVYYVDSFDALAEDGYLPEGVSSDGINLNKEYCIKLLNYITRKAYIPDESDLVSSGETDDESYDSEEDVSSDEYDTETQSAYDDESDSDSDEVSDDTSADSDTDTSESSESTGSRRKSADTSESDPEPTVNVLKDSANGRN